MLRGEEFPGGSLAAACKAWVNRSPLRARLGRGLFWSAFATAVPQVLLLLTSVFVTRILGSVRYGEFGVIQSTLAIFDVLSGTALGWAATKYVAEFKDQDKARTARVIAASLGIAAFLAVLLSMALYLAAPELARKFFHRPQLTAAVQLAAIVLFFNMYNGAQTGVLAGFEAFRKIAIVSLLRSAVALPAMILLTRQFGVLGAVAALGIMALVHCTAMSVVLHRMRVATTVLFKWQDWMPDVKLIVSFSIPAALGAFLLPPAIWFANTRLIDTPNGYAEMGIFSAANQWRSALLFLPGIINRPFLPILSHSFANASVAVYRKVLRVNLTLVSAVVIVPALLVVGFAGLVMRAYGHEFAGHSSVLILLSLTTVLAACASVLGGAIASMGKMWHGLLLNAFMVCAFLGSFRFTIGRGAVGLALAFLVAYAVHAAVCAGYVGFILRRSLSRRAAQDFIDQESTVRS